MSLSVYFDKDIAHILESVYLAGQFQQTQFRQQLAALVQDTEQRRGLEESTETYQRGYEDALRAVGVAFGLGDEGAVVVSGEQKLLS